MRPRKPTYWHLGAGRRVPSRYDVVSSRLHYHTALGFAVDTPTARWLDEHTRSPLDVDWEAFTDPQHTTYASYVVRQRDNETHLARLLARAEHEKPPSHAWRERLSRGLSPLRFVYHGLMMAAGYAGSLAPSGRITLVYAFQAANELQRVQILARRLAQLRTHAAELGDDGRQVFEDDEAWQPLREALETLLTTYAWGPCALQLSLLFKPAIDQLAFVNFAAQARAHGDLITAEVLGALAHESAWEQACARELLALAHPHRDLIDSWLERARPLLARAATSLVPVLGSAPSP